MGRSRGRYISTDIVVCTRTRLFDLPRVARSRFGLTTSLEYRVLSDEPALRRCRSSAGEWRIGDFVLLVSLCFFLETLRALLGHMRRCTTCLYTSISSRCEPTQVVALLRSTSPLSEHLATAHTRSGRPLACSGASSRSSYVPRQRLPLIARATTRHGPVFVDGGGVGHRSSSTARPGVQEGSIGRRRCPEYAGDLAAPARWV